MKNKIIAFYIGQLGNIVYNFYENTLFNRVNMFSDNGILAIYDCETGQFIKLKNNKIIVAACHDILKTAIAMGV